MPKVRIEDYQEEDSKPVVRVSKPKCKIRKMKKD